ncbi:MAG: NTP transferase domain-containing protein [Planctomycetales bacterium]|nr:NTP transferase domain-containing protein [Planctomycetales bacterium]
MAGLCGGLPKPLLPVCGRSLLGRELDALAAAGVRELLVTAEHRAEEVAAAARSAAPAGLRVEVEVLEATEGIADSLARLAPRLPGPFLLWLGDIAAGAPDLAALAAPVERGEAGAALAVAREPDPARRGRNFAVFTEADGRVTRVAEKSAEPGTEWKGTGLYAFAPGILFACAGTEPSPLRGERELTDAIGRFLGRGARAVAVPATRWDVNVTAPEDLREAALRALDDLGRDSWIGPGAEVHPGARLRRAVVEAGARVEAPVEVRDSVLLPGASVRETVTDRIVESCGAGA